MGKIEAARVWVKERCQPLVAELSSARAERGAAYAALWHALRIRRYIDADGNMRGYTISDEASMYLYRRAFELPDAFDVAKEIAFQNVGGGVELAVGLRHFVCASIGGNFRRPRGRGRARDFIGDWLLLDVLEELVARFDLRPTRNDASEHNDSACDLVSEAFAAAPRPPRALAPSRHSPSALASARRPPSYKALKAIWFDKALRAEIAQIQQLKASRDQAELPAFVCDDQSPFAVSEK